MVVGAGKGRTRGHGCGRENHAEMEWEVAMWEVAVTPALGQKIKLIKIKKKKKNEKRKCVMRWKCRGPGKWENGVCGVCVWFWTGFYFFGRKCYISLNILVSNLQKYVLISFHIA
jgi:hypothetical protein